MNSWENIIKEESKKEYFQILQEKLEMERRNYEVYPKEEEIFRALSCTPLDQVKVVFLGQDPYHEPNQACGLAFSVPRGEKIPPSLRNIYKELHNDLGIMIPCHGDISNLTKEGVLLINSVLTVRSHEAMSHHNFGWIQFTDKLIQELDKENHPIVFILLGNAAKTKKELIKIENAVKSGEFRNLELVSKEGISKKEVIIQILRMLKTDSGNANLKLFNKTEKFSDRVGRKNSITLSNGSIFNCSVTGIKEDIYEF